jgi:hypothetical protein
MEKMRRKICTKVCDDYDKTDRCIRREYNNGQASSRLQHASSS